MNSVESLSAQGLTMVHSPTGPCHRHHVGAPTGGHRALGAHGGAARAGSPEARSR
jgi:hypothetical protein